MKEMNWTEFLVDSVFVGMIYSNPPDLSNVSLHEIELNRDSSALKLRFDVADFPNKPPQKWISNEFDQAQFTLKIIEITSLKIEGWSNKPDGAISITKNENQLHLSFSGKKEVIQCCGRFLILEAITGYRQ